MQLAAQRIALNLREAGFNLQMAGAGIRHANLVLRKLPISAGSPAAVLEQLMRSAGDLTPVAAETPSALFKVEKTYLEEEKLIPLLNLPLAYAAGPRVRDLHLHADGTPDLADASLEDMR
jgi:MarR-like DNA-binding transcriptional regulator SgrR of sgrS sRNA